MISIVMVLLVERLTMFGVLLLALMVLVMVVVLMVVALFKNDEFVVNGFVVVTMCAEMGPPFQFHHDAISNQEMN